MEGFICTLKDSPEFQGMLRKLVCPNPSLDTPNGFHDSFNAC